MARSRLRTEARMLRMALWRRRGTMALAVLAVAIGASVASALLHVSGDIGNKVTRELRVLGPNLLVVPAGSGDGGEAGFLDEALLRSRLAAAGIDGLPLLYAVADLGGRRVPVVGADLASARRLHPAWRISTVAGAADGAGAGGALVGARLMARLGIKVGDTVTLAPAGGRGEPVTVAIAGRLEAGGADDEALWIPLAAAQTVSGRASRVSLAQARISDGSGSAAAVAALGRDGTLRPIVLHALSATEGRLLERMRRLMALVTIAALIAAGLCAFGTLTDLALERRREIALMKALGATRQDVVRLFVAESLAIGAVGGVVGWAFGLVMAQIIGRQVFHSPIAVHGSVPFVVVALSLGVAGVAGLGPIRLALAVEPAPVLKGD